MSEINPDENSSFNINILPNCVPHAGDIWDPSAQMAVFKNRLIKLCWGSAVANGI